MPLAAQFFVKILSNILSIYLHIYLECWSWAFSCRMQDSRFFLGQGLPCLALYRLATQLQIAKGELFGFFTEPILLQWFIICLVVPTAAISLPTLFSAKTYIPWTI